MIYERKPRKEGINGTVRAIVDDEYDKIYTLKQLSKKNKFVQELFDKGEEWFKSGLSLEDAPEEFRNDSSFVRGFEKGKRLAYIQELEDRNKKIR